MVDGDNSFQAVSFFLCPTFLTAYLLSTRQTEIGMAADDLQVDVMTASSVGLAWWLDNHAHPIPYTDEVAWNAQAYIQFQSTWDKFTYSIDNSAESTYRYSFAPISSECNARLMAVAGQRNGIHFLSDIHVEDKDNVPSHGHD